ncbi:hypothetical protein P3T76_006227 [Phytophthora citrophthora]|uniref:Uncharacterized protein n=1 Tax=Phytophthora citrophthora TaxID=4793 RepID=A0AAD9LMK4_9STRA|nr:hypothetical protein P3T76_006227 [Phytophthora citrophthora]
MARTDVIHCKLLTLNKVENEGSNMKQCVAEMEKWIADPSETDYWIPATSLCDTVDAVAKWMFPDQAERFCFLQLTMASTHKRNEMYAGSLCSHS